MICVTRGQHGIFNEERL